jgi:hypothetical protein
LRLDPLTTRWVQVVVPETDVAVGLSDRREGVRRQIKGRPAIYTHVDEAIGVDAGTPTDLAYSLEDFTWSGSGDAPYYYISGALIRYE